MTNKQILENIGGRIVYVPATNRYRCRNAHGNWVTYRYRKALLLLHAFGLDGYIRRAVGLIKKQALKT